MSRSLLLAFAFAALAAGCVAEVAPAPDITDDDADTAGDPGEADMIDNLLTTDADAPGVTITADNAATADADGDGIPDATEEMLLRRYRPYYKFSQNSDGKDETYRPADAVAAMFDAQLRTDYDNGGGISDPLSGCGRSGDHHLSPPDQLYTCRADTSLAATHAKSSYALNLADAGYGGVSFDEAKAEATGMYGHVSPTTINGHDAYQIEYWQFYAFNNQDMSILGLGSFGDHEGDWTGVMVTFDLEEHRIVRVRYLIHGKNVTFDIPSMATCRGCMVEMHGANYDPNPPEFFANVDAYSNNAAQFYVDGTGYKHVVVYIERGAHETWPGAWGHAAVKVGPLTFHLDPHNGDGPSYLVPDVQDRLFNMGEVDHPLTRAGRLVMSFDGFWGSTNSHEAGFWGPVRRSPVGPAVHCEWKWPDRGSVAACEH